MEVIPVVDIKDGIAVRGVAGKRSEYRPLETPLCRGCDPCEVAKALLQHTGCKQIYVAHLDAIGAGPAGPVSAESLAQMFALAQFAKENGAKLWLDAGIGTVEKWDAVFSKMDGVLRRVITPVLGLESLESPVALLELATERDPREAVFSVDMMAGELLTTFPAWEDLQAFHVVLCADIVRIQRILLLDLADVGVGQGTRTIELLNELAPKLPQMTWYAGGGVRSEADLQILKRAGFAGVLVASAIHSGALGAESFR